MPKLSRLQQLEIFADLWLKVYLFHPAILSRPIDWHGLGLAALAKLKASASPDDFLLLINHTLLAPLKDPQTLLYPLSNPPPFAAPPSPAFQRRHRGWSESSQAYIYQQDWTADPQPSLHHTHYFEHLGFALNRHLAQPPEQLHFPDFTTQAETRELSREQRLLGVIKVHGVLAYFAPGFIAPELTTWLAQAEAAQDKAAYGAVLQALAAPLQDKHVQIRFSDPAAAPENPPKRYALLPEVSKHARQLADNIGYMTPFSMPSRQVLAQAFQLLKNTRALIIDLRGYPRSHFKQDFIQHLCAYPVSSPEYAIPLITQPKPAPAAWQRLQHCIQPKADREVYKKPVIVLMDESMQSAAEDVLMYLRNAKRAILLGRSSAGGQGNAAFIELPGGGWMSFTGMEVRDHKGLAIQRLGIEPDIKVVQGSGKQDEILAAALKQFAE